MENNTILLNRKGEVLFLDNVSLFVFQDTIFVWHKLKRKVLEDVAVIVKKPLKVDTFGGYLVGLNFINTINRKNKL
jgi:hypothetical protein